MPASNRWHYNINGKIPWKKQLPVAAPQKTNEENQD